MQQFMAQDVVAIRFAEGRWLAATYGSPKSTEAIETVAIINSGTSVITFKSAIRDLISCVVWWPYLGLTRYFKIFHARSASTLLVVHLLAAWSAAATLMDSGWTKWTKECRRDRH